MNLLGLGGLNKDSNGLGEAGADSKATREAVSALRNLTTNNTANCEAVQQADGLGGLIVLLQAGPSHKVATDAAAVLSHIAAVSPTSHDAIREAGGILPLVALLFGDAKSEGLAWGARCLAHLSNENQTNRNVICEQHGCIQQLVNMLANGASTDGAREAAAVLRCLMRGNDEKISVTVLAALRRQGVGIGDKATFTLSDEFPELLEGLIKVVGNWLAAAVKKGTDRGHIQMALNDAVALGVPEWQLREAREKIEAINAARGMGSERSPTKKDSQRRTSPPRSYRSGRPGSPEKSVSRPKSPESASSPEAARSPVPEISESSGAAMAMLLQAQQRLKDLEMAAIEARRKRRDAEAARLATGKQLTPSMRRQVNASRPQVNLKAAGAEKPKAVVQQAEQEPAQEDGEVVPAEGGESPTPPPSLPTEDPTDEVVAGAT